MKMYRPGECLIGMAHALVNEMCADNGVLFMVKDTQATELNNLCNDQELWCLTWQDITTLASGEAGEQEQIAARNPKLQRVHELLNEIFENEEAP